MICSCGKVAMCQTKKEQNGFVVNTNFIKYRLTVWECPFDIHFLFFAIYLHLESILSKSLFSMLQSCKRPLNSLPDSEVGPCAISALGLKSSYFTKILILE